MPSLEHFCTITATLENMKVIGSVPSGMRIDFPFEGTATGPHWEGELLVGASTTSPCAETAT